MKKSLLLIAVLFAGFVSASHGQSSVTFTSGPGCSPAEDECIEQIKGQFGPLVFTPPEPDLVHRESFTLVNGCVPATKFQLTFTVSNPPNKDKVEVIVTTCSKKGTWGKPKRKFYSVLPELWGR